MTLRRFLVLVKGLPGDSAFSRFYEEHGKNETSVPEFDARKLEQALK